MSNLQLILYATLAFSPPSTETHAEAVRTYQAGRVHFEAAEYGEALAQFHRAMELEPAPALHYNIALCQMRLGDYDSAIASFEAYLRDADPSDRADVEFLIQDARRRREAEKEREAIDAPPPVLTAETHATQVDTPAAPLGRTRQHRPLVIAGGTLVGIGLAAGIGGAVGFGMAVQDANENVEAYNRNPARSGLSTRDAFNEELKASRYEVLQYAAIGVGAAAVTTGIVLLSVGIHRRTKASRLAESGVQVAPTSLHRGGGVTLAGRF